MRKIDGEIRTSVIVEPANGKMPYSAEGRARLAKAQTDMFSVYDDPEARPSPERCLAGGSGSTGAPIFTARYNGHYQLVQTEDHLVISMEQNRQVRIIPAPLRTEKRTAPLDGEFDRPLGGRYARRRDRRLHAGDAYKPASAIYVSENAKVTERFTRISPTEILYRFAIEDPAVFTQAWRGEQLFYVTPNRVRNRLPRRQLFVAGHPRRRTGNGPAEEERGQVAPHAPRSMQARPLLN